jgi:hypothetical protein
MIYKNPVFSVSDTARFAEDIDRFIRLDSFNRMDEYKKVRLCCLPETYCKLFVPDLSLYASNPLGEAPTFLLEEYSNYYDLKPTNTDEEFQEELLSKAAKVSIEIATTVDFLIRKQAQTLGIDHKRNLDRLYATHLYVRSDGSPNFKVRVVKSACFSNPDGQESEGWISYKFLFACGR